MTHPLPSLATALAVMPAPGSGATDLPALTEVGRDEDVMIGVRARERSGVVHGTGLCDGTDLYGLNDARHLITPQRDLGRLPLGELVRSLCPLHRCAASVTATPTTGYSTVLGGLEGLLQKVRPLREPPPLPSPLSLKTLEDLLSRLDALRSSLHRDVDELRRIEPSLFPAGQEQEVRTLLLRALRPAPEPLVRSILRNAALNPEKLELPAGFVAPRAGTPEDLLMLVTARGSLSSAVRLVPDLLSLGQTRQGSHVVRGPLLLASLLHVREVVGQLTPASSLVDALDPGGVEPPDLAAALVLLDPAGGFPTLSAALAGARAL